MMKLSVAPQDAWQPLPPGDWNADAARHLLRRSGWTARPADVERAVSEGLSATIDRLFPASPTLFPEPAMVANFAEAAPAYVQRIRTAPPEDRRLLQREQRERAQATLTNMTVRWMQFASQAENSAIEKWVLFLSDIYVVSFEKVYNPPLIFKHFDILARHALGPAPELTKAVSRSPAMMIYLDLNQNQKKAPNENFARELFELFLLGEGNYTEADIKQAARAFTGYRTRPAFGDVILVDNQHDDGEKTVFGETGNYNGDDVIDAAYRQPAAGAFLPHEMVKFYLSDTMLPRDYLYGLGSAWSSEGEYSLRWLARRFFASRIFFAPEFRGEFIKSPVQFYLGLLQDLSLDVAPVPRFIVGPLRQMGQILYQPPNVRGWVGGRNWINSATLAARRTMTESAFTAIDEDALNADEQVEIVAARLNGADRFTVSDQSLRSFAGMTPEAAVSHFTSILLAKPPMPAFTAALSDFIAQGPAEPAQRMHRLRRAIATLLEAPEYQLC